MCVLTVRVCACVCVFVGTELRSRLEAVLTENEQLQRNVQLLREDQTRSSAVSQDLEEAQSMVHKLRQDLSQSEQRCADMRQVRGNSYFELNGSVSYGLML